MPKNCAHVLLIFCAYKTHNCTWMGTLQDCSVCLFSCYECLIKFQNDNISENDISYHFSYYFTQLKRCYLNVAYIYNLQISTFMYQLKLNAKFDQQKCVEAKVYTKPGKIYCYSMFQGHHDSIIKRLVKHASKERYKISIN